MNLLVINIHSSANAGDAALTDRTLDDLRAAFPGAEITLSMDDPSSHSGDERVVPSILHWVKSTRAGTRSTWNLRNLAIFLPASLLSLLVYRVARRRIFPFMSSMQRASIEAFFDADLAVSKPGGFLYSTGGIGMPLLLTMYTIAYAVFSGAPHYMLPQSIGPFTARWQERALRWVLNRTRITMLREPISLDAMRRIGVRTERYAPVADMAFALPPANATAGADWLRNHGIAQNDGRARVGVTVLNWAAQDQSFDAQANYEHALAAALTVFMQQTNAQLIFFPQVTGPTIEQDDRVVAQRVAKEMRATGAEADMLDEPMTVEQIRNAIASMDMFIGTRMHSNIFALSAGVPVVAIGYLHKTRGIMRMAGVESHVADIGALNADELLHLLMNTWNARAALHVQVTAAAAALRASANTAMELIRADLRTSGRLP